MPWQPDRAGLAEACLDGIKAAIVAKLADLTAILAVAPAIPLGSHDDGTPVVVDDTFIRIGDPEVVSRAEDYPFWICVVGGGKQDGRDTHVEINASGPQYRATTWHNIYLYLHPLTFPMTDPIAQAELRERFRARLQDWLTWDVFNNPTGIEVPLTSRQFAVAPGFDVLTRVYVTDVTKGFVMKAGGIDWVFMAHFTLEGLLLGGY